MGHGMMDGPRDIDPMEINRASFLFLYFFKLFDTEIYFRFHNLQFCTPTARLRGGRLPAANWRGGRDLNVNKIYF